MNIGPRCPPCPRCPPRELASRAEDDNRRVGLHMPLGPIGPISPIGPIGLLQQWQAVGGGLAGAGLCQCDEVGVVVQQIRDDFLLYGHRLFVAQFIDGLQQRFGKPQFSKILHIGCKGTNKNEE